MSQVFPFEQGVFVITVYVLLWFGGLAINPIPPMADLASCERVRAAAPNNKLIGHESKCVQVLIPSPSFEAWRFMQGTK